MGGLDLTWLLQEGELEVYRTPLSWVLIKTALRCEELDRSKPPRGPEPALAALCFLFQCRQGSACRSECPVLVVWPLGWPPSMFAAPVSLSLWAQAMVGAPRESTTQLSVLMCVGVVGADGRQGCLSPQV